MSRVGLLLAGVQKAGTTTLHALMAQLPGLAPPGGVKELHFFDDEAQDWSAPDTATLHAAFAGQNPAALWFESTPITLFWPPALARVRAYNPGMKLVLVFRDPVERAHSHWAMQCSRGWESLSFAGALAAEAGRGAAEPLGPGRRLFSYAERGMYGGQLQRALALFPRHQLLLLRFDDLVVDAEAVLRQVAAFAGVPPPAAPLTPLHLNPRGTTMPPLSEADAAALAPRFRDDLALFARLSRLDVSGWLPMR